MVFVHLINQIKTQNGGGILLYVREDIPSNLVASAETPIETFYLKVNLQISG